MLRRSLLPALALLLAAQAADAQLVGQTLYERGFRSVVYVCGQVGTTCRASFDPSRSDYAGRYGHPVTASKGSLSGERCGGFQQPGSWLHVALDLPEGYVVTGVDRDDLLYVSRGGTRPACDELQASSGGGETGDCPHPWQCSPLPDVLRDGCLVGTHHCAGVGASLPICWQAPSRTIRRRPLVYYAEGVPGCDPTLTVEPPPPPPEPCGDGTCDFAERQPGAWCVADCGEPPVNPPPPPVACTPPAEVSSRLAEVERALAALLAAWERWATTPGPASTGGTETVMRGEP